LFGLAPFMFTSVLPSRTPPPQTKSRHHHGTSRQREHRRWSDREWLFQGLYTTSEEISAVTKEKDA
jgi:hypothetical protein